MIAHSAPDAERAVLGALLIEPDSFDQVAGLLRPEDFADATNAHWFGAIAYRATHGEAFDPISLADAIGHKALGPLIDLARSTGSASNIESYARIVRNKARLRMLRRVCDEVAGESDLGQAADKLHHALDALHDGIATGPKLIADYAAEYEAQDRDGKMATGLLDLDEKSGGVGAGELCIIAARTNVGKSMLLYQVAMRQAREGTPVLCFWVEDPGTEAYARTLRAHLPTDAQLWLDETSPLSLSQLYATARSMKRKHGIQAIFVDYLQLIRAPGTSKNERMEEVSSGLKSLAKQLDIPVYAAAQLNRDAAGRSPSLEHLRDSGAIEQDANQVWLLHVDERFPGTMEIHVAKNKSGPKGVALVRHIADQFRVVSADEGSIASYWAGKSKRGSASALRETL